MLCTFYSELWITYAFLIWCSQMWNSSNFDYYYYYYMCIIIITCPILGSLTGVFFLSEGRIIMFMFFSSFCGTSDRWNKPLKLSLSLLPPLSLSLSIYIYIYIYIDMCVCVWRWFNQNLIYIYIYIYIIKLSSHLSFWYLLLK